MWALVKPLKLSLPVTTECKLYVSSATRTKWPVFSPFFLPVEFCQRKQFQRIFK